MEALASEQKDMTKKLVEDMIQAVMDDHKAIKTQSGPALKRIMMLKDMD